MEKGNGCIYCGGYVVKYAKMCANCHRKLQLVRYLKKMEYIKNSRYERIKEMSLDQMAEFFSNLLLGAYSDGFNLVDAKIYEKEEQKKWLEQEVAE